MGLEIGQKASFTKTITETDVYNFAGIVGDFNSVHVDKVKAEKSIFKARIAHGMLVGSLISTVLGTKLPGEGTIYLEQNLKFKAPAYFEDTLTAEVEIKEILNTKKGIYKLNTIVRNQNSVCIAEGFAVVQYQN